MASEIERKDVSLYHDQFKDLVIAQSVKALFQEVCSLKTRILASLMTVET